MLLEEVREAISSQKLLAPGEQVVVGVSGGPDSLALLHLLFRLAPELALSLHVAHLNHRLRGGDSDADAAFVAQTAENLGLPSTIEERDVAALARSKGLSIEEAARVARYRFLAETARRLGARTVAVGHNADDQVETVVMHFLRGSGLAGLRGMLYRSPLPYPPPATGGRGEGVFLIRPLLDVTRVEIEQYCADNGLQPRLDRSNEDVSIFRNRLRHEVIPYLERFNPNLRQVLRHTASAVADDYSLLRAEIEQAFEDVAREAGSVYVFRRDAWVALPPGLQRATLREAIHRLKFGLRNINWVHIEEARRVGIHGGVGAEATLPQGLSLVVGYDDLTIGETVLRPDWPLLFDEQIPLPINLPTQIPGTGWQVQARPSETTATQASEAESGPGGWTASIDLDCVRGSLVLRTRRPGDRFQPIRLGGHGKTLHDFMINEKIPRTVRDHLPLLVDADKILWVCGFRLDERAKVTDDTRRVLRIEFRKVSG